uniref:Kelch like family member 10 n=1 Tax=Neogobius melanostomus TaxID=47308 RepID=A0A8C6S8V8_9GOBI
MSAQTPVFQEMRRGRKLCDAVLSVAGVQFPVHKIVLCGCSSYFKALFTHWSSPDCEAFEIPHLSAHVMEILLDYVYTGVLSVTNENFQELFITADRFNLSGFTQACCRAMEEQLTPQNAISAWWFSNTYYYPELGSQVFDYIMKHFEEVIARCEEDFLQLSIEDLGKIIGEDRLNVREESTVFEAVLSWIIHDRRERERHLTELLSKIRLARITPEYFNQSIRCCELVRQNRDCRALIRTAMKLMTNVRIPSCNASLFPEPLARPRLPRAILVAIGGWSGRDMVNRIESFDNRADCWMSVANDDETPRAYHGTVFLNGSLYLIGGCDELAEQRTVHRYDLAKRTWQEVGPMRSKRCYVSVALLDGLIYAMGGSDGLRRLETAERYTPDLNQWTMVAPMNEMRSDASSTAHNGKVFITNTWRPMPSMMTARSNFGIQVLEERLYVVGGYDGSTTINSVESLDFNTGVWSQAQHMGIPRSGLSCSLVFDLPNMADYAAAFPSLPQDNDMEK